MSLRWSVRTRDCFVQYIQFDMADLGQRKECLVPTRWSKEGGRMLKSKREGEAKVTARGADVSPMQCK